MLIIGWQYPKDRAVVYLSTSHSFVSNRDNALKFSNISNIFEYISKNSEPFINTSWGFKIIKLEETVTVTEKIILED